MRPCNYPHSCACEVPAQVLSVDVSQHFNCDAQRCHSSAELKRSWWSALQLMMGFELESVGI